MSVLIKGMEMPKRCLYCPFMISRDNDDCILQSDEANAKFNSWDDMKASCPLVEIPTPHGRLIDADKLLEKAYWDYNEATHDYNNFKVVSEYDIADAPTVIEAEG